MEKKESEDLEKLKTMYEGATKGAVKIIADFFQGKITREQLKEKLEPYKWFQESLDRGLWELLRKTFKGEEKG